LTVKALPFSLPAFLVAFYVPTRARTVFAWTAMVPDGTCLPMNQPPSRPGAMRFAGAGAELAATILLCMFLGHRLDRAMALNRPWGMIVGALLGLTVSMYRLFRQLIPRNPAP
jgi:hypothetical protein